MEGSFSNVSVRGCNRPQHRCIGCASPKALVLLIRPLTYAKTAGFHPRGWRTIWVNHGKPNSFHSIIGLAWLNEKLLPSSNRCKGTFPPKSHHNFRPSVLPFSLRWALQSPDQMITLGPRAMAVYGCSMLWPHLACMCELKEAAAKTGVMATWNQD